jgi:hypothetical protein
LRVAQSQISSDRIADMNKIVLEHYPASRLPEELREGIAANASVRVTVEEESELRPLSREELLVSLREATSSSCSARAKEKSLIC